MSDHRIQMYTQGHDIKFVMQSTLEYIEGIDGNVNGRTVKTKEYGSHLYFSLRVVRFPASLRVSESEKMCLVDFQSNRNCSGIVSGIHAGHTSEQFGFAGRAK